MSKVSFRILGKVILAVLVFLSFSILLQNCSSYQEYHFRKNYSDANKLQHNTKNLSEKPFLKAHFKNGNVSILRDSWTIDDTLNNTLNGFGTTYDFNRNKISSGDLVIHIDSVAIFETNKELSNPESERISGISIITAINAAFTAICVINPKACFGSCPTFYINENDNVHSADAEAFSSAIAPSLEYADIDALDNESLENNSFALTMKNEALETHCIKDVKLLAYPRTKSERIYHSNLNEFYLCNKTYSINSAVQKNTDITDLLIKKDKNEWYSYASENNMSEKEEIILRFNTDNKTNELGLLLNFRQTLMTTYLIYSAMGYMGDEVGDMFAKIESNEKINAQLKNGIKKELGNLEIYVKNQKDGQWIHQGFLNETGPIAINKQFIQLKNYTSHGTTEVKIVLNKGLWRLDYAALCSIKKKITPLYIEPEKVTRGNVLNDRALTLLCDSTKYLITYPGDNYKMFFAPACK